jgi:hypothetical protein
LRLFTEGGFEPLGRVIIPRTVAVGVVAALADACAIIGHIRARGMEARAGGMAVGYAVGECALGWFSNLARNCGAPWIVRAVGPLAASVYVGTKVVQIFDPRFTVLKGWAVTAAAIGTLMVLSGAGMIFYAPPWKAAGR